MIIKSIRKVELLIGFGHSHALWRMQDCKDQMEMQVFSLLVFLLEIELIQVILVSPKWHISIIKILEAI